MDQENRTRGLQIALFEKIDSRLDELTKALQDVRDRVIRIEAQDPSAKISALDTRVRAIEEWKSRLAGQVALIVVPIAAAVGFIIKVIVDTVAKGAPSL